jgi:hypothetical protein
VEILPGTLLNKITMTSLKNTRPLIAIVLLVSLGFLSFFIYRADSEKRVVKDDLIELSNIKYGLFNVDEWKKILADILTKKINELEIDTKNRGQMREKVSDFLSKIISDLEARYHEQNSNSIGGFFRSGIAVLTGTFGKIKEDIPIFTEQILDFLSDPNNKKAVRSYLISKLNDYADNTFAKVDYSVHDSIIKRYNFADRPTTISSLSKNLSELQQTSNSYKYLFVFLSLLTATMIIISKCLSKAEFIIISATCFLFLMLGLTLPMIEIDARISEMKLSLLGEEISFQDQVLYYKSKSILAVVHLMIAQGSLDLLLVGILVFIFSVFFPISKLISSIFLVSRPALESNKIIRFLVYRTGKWSMADVMVVAIFMSYVGFSGILTEQLKQLDDLSQKMEVLTTNKSSLQIGFFAFTSFALLSLLTTNKLKDKLDKPTSAQ